MPRSTSLLATGRRPIVVGGTGLYLRAALTELSLRPPPADRGSASAGRAELERGPAELHAVLASSVRHGRRTTIDPGDRHRIVRALELLEAGQARAAARAERAVDDRGPTSDAARRARDGADALYERIDARVDAMIAAGAADEVRAPRHVPAQVDDRSQGARLRGAARRRCRGDEAPHPQLRAPAADLDAQARTAFTRST